MKIVFNVKNLYDDRYAVTWQQDMGDGTVKQQVATFHSTDFSLEAFLRRCRTSISGYLSNLRVKNPRIPKAGSTYGVYQWDGDVSCLPNNYKRQAEKRNELSELLKEGQPTVESKPEEPQLFEIVKRNDVWTIVKHETELMTWEEACNELAKRIA